MLIFFIIWLTSYKGYWTTYKNEKNVMFYLHQITKRTYKHYFLYLNCKHNRIIFSPQIRRHLDCVIRWNALWRHCRCEELRYRWRHNKKPTSVLLKRNGFFDFKWGYTGLFKQSYYISWYKTFDCFLQTDG